MHSVKKVNQLTDAERQKLQEDLKKDPGTIQPDWSINWKCSVDDSPSQ